MKQGMPVRMSLEMLMAGISAVEPRLRMSLVLGALVATSDQLGLEERELLRMVRVAWCQRAIAVMLTQKGSAIFDAQGRPAMPTGTEQHVELARAVSWECPLCGAYVPTGVKHKHTAHDWMTGRVLPMGGTEEDFAKSREHQREASTVEEPPTFDEGGETAGAWQQCGAFGESLPGMRVRALSLRSGRASGLRPGREAAPFPGSERSNSTVGRVRSERGVNSP